MCSLCTSPIPSTANELSTPLNLKSIFVAFVGSVFVNVLGKIANTPPPSFPPVIFSIASRWSGFAFGSMYTRPVPFPMWIARGHRRPHANVVPSSLVVPNVPFRMCHDTSASQLPVVGSALKLHGHPHAQLQLWMYSASIFHFVGIDQTSGPEMGIRRPILNRSRNGFRLGPSVPYIHATTIVTRGRMGEATGQGPAILLRRVTIPVAAAVALVVAAAWYATWTSSGFLMALMAPSTIVLSDLVLFFVLLVVMMVAMMLPSALPMIVAFRGMTRLEAGRPTKHADDAATALFIAPYFLVWGAFGVAALLALSALGLMGTMTGPLAFASAVTLVAAGLWQVTRTKEVCLTHCTSPMSFVLHHWRSGRSGAVRMGFRHSLYCIGCCWLFMLVLFVSGSMSLLWMGGLSVVIFAEKLGVRQDLFARAIGVVLVALGGLAVFGAGLPR